MKMNDSDTTGGPAFPEPVSVSPSGDTYSAYGGMTLRDYFAAQALPAILGATAANAHCPREGMNIRQSMAMDAYEMADELLKARAMVSVRHPLNVAA